MEGDLNPPLLEGLDLHCFYPRPPGGGRLINTLPIRFTSAVSIHALRVEGDIAQNWRPRLYRVFLSTPSGWRATRFGTEGSYGVEFLSTPSGWRATYRVPGLREPCAVSIHALRVEGDLLREYIDTAQAGVSIHALRVEGDRFCSSAPRPDPMFLSTPSGWRATPLSGLDDLVILVSIHALRVEGDIERYYVSMYLKVSIHALRVEGDLLLLGQARGELVSIHALRVEGDYGLPNTRRESVRFLSTPSGWRAT